MDLWCNYSSLCDGHPNRPNLHRPDVSWHFRSYNLVLSLNFMNFLPMCNKWIEFLSKLKMVSNERKYFIFAEINPFLREIEVEFVKSWTSFSAALLASRGNSPNFLRKVFLKKNIFPKYFQQKFSPLDSVPWIAKWSQELHLSSGILCQWYIPKNLRLHCSSDPGWWNMRFNHWKFQLLCDFSWNDESSIHGQKW